MATATGGFEVDDWNEETYQELDGDAKLTRASVTQTFSGDIDGQGHVEWLMCYRKDGTALFVGVQRIEGSVRGRAGTFVLASNGEFDGEKASGSWEVVTGAGTEDLADLAGSGKWGAPLGSKGTYELDITE